jgi:large subunit ribosomal protein L1
MDFDVVIASPDAMKVVGALGQIPRPARADAESESRHRDTQRCRSGERMRAAARFSTAPTRRRIIQCTIGRASFAPEQLKTNLLALNRGAQQGKATGHERNLSQEESASPRRWGRACRVDTASLAQQTPAS